MRPRTWLFTQQTNIQKPMDKQWIQKIILEKKKPSGWTAASVPIPCGTLIQHTAMRTAWIFFHWNLISATIPSTVRLFMSTWLPLPAIQSSILLTSREVPTMSEFMIRDIFCASYSSFCEKNSPLSEVQRKTARAIIRCKSKTCGCNISICTECGHTETHYNSCRNRNCPSCQACGCHTLKPAGRVYADSFWPIFECYKIFERPPFGRSAKHAQTAGTARRSLQLQLFC